jgi:hypothetical protein
MAKKTLCQPTGSNLWAGIELRILDLQSTIIDCSSEGPAESSGPW